jgi:hypothetical protein
MKYYMYRYISNIIWNRNIKIKEKKKYEKIIRKEYKRND